MSDETRPTGAELWEEFAASGGDAPARLKSRVFSRLNLEQAKEGPLASVSESKAAGRALCVFEEIMEVAPTGDAIKRMNYCRVCHARVLAEKMEQAPIWWPGCPYAEFQK
jgi:hypothetical protein